MVPWIIVEPIRQLIFLAFAITCTWISSILAREVSVPVSVAVTALIIFSINYYTIINTTSLLQLNEMYSVNYLGMAFYFWMVVKAQRDRMQPATNKVFAKSEIIGTNTVLKN